MKRENIVIAVAGLLLVAVCLPVFFTYSTAGANPSEQSNIISVYGEAEISVQPDSARVILAVETTHEQAKTAVEENARISNAVLEALAKQGLDEKQCKTSGYQLNSYSQQIDPKNGGKYVTKYRAYNELNISLSNLDEVGSIIDTAVKAGANRVHSVQFERKDAEALKLQALQDATLQAKTKAEAIARGAGIAIKGVKVINEEMSGYYPYRAAMNENLKVMEAASTSILPDDVEVTARVRADYYF